MIKIDPKKKLVTVTSGTLELRTLNDLEPFGIRVTETSDGQYGMDANGWTLDARKHSGNKLPIDSEARPPALRIKLPGLILVGMKFRGSPNGITVSADNVWLVSCQFSEIGEDALALLRVRGCRITRCVFGSATDKTIQANDCEDTAIVDCTFRKSRNAIRVSGGSLRTLAGNFFYDTDTAVHVARGGRATKGKGNRWHNVRQKYKAEGGGKFTA